MVDKNKDIWIEKGYELFALEGKSGMKVEPLAKLVGKSKSSFYHYFADMELFVEQLLDYHLHQSHVMAIKEQEAKNVDPELIEVLVEHKMDLLFNRQLRIHQNNPLFAATLESSNEIVGKAFVYMWASDLGLQLSAKQTEGFFILAMENFFLQINSDNLNQSWLKQYFASLKNISTYFRV